MKNQGALCKKTSDGCIGKTGDDGLVEKIGP